jgi:hypothetical protein
MQVSRITITFNKIRINKSVELYESNSRESLLHSIRLELIKV